MASLRDNIEALADPTRRRILEALTDEPMRAGALAREVTMSAPALSRHLRVLRQYGAVVEKRDPQDNRARVYELRPGAFAPLRAYLDEFERHWRGQLTAFRDYVERDG